MLNLPKYHIFLDFDGLKTKVTDNKSSEYCVRYLLIDLDVNLVPLSVTANQLQGFMEIRHCDWLLPRLVQD